MTTDDDRQAAIRLAHLAQLDAEDGQGLGVFGLAGGVLLAVPLLAALLVWQGVQATALRTARAPGWVAAVVGGVLLAWPVAVTLPIG
jgi:hypothetical protein